MPSRLVMSHTWSQEGTGTGEGGAQAEQSTDERERGVGVGEAGEQCEGKGWKTVCSAIEGGMGWEEKPDKGGVRKGEGEKEGTFEG